MRVLIAGPGGFIGAHLARACVGAGHAVIGAGRTMTATPGTGHVHLDYAALPPPEALASELRGVDVVVNAVGILRPAGAQTFDALHDRGPRALFAAAAAAGVRRIIQISALGAEPEALSEYHRSKSRADRALMAMGVDWVIVMPSLVYGPGGASARMFNMLASLPVIPLPAGGAQRIQPVHIDDLIAALLRLVESPVELRCVLPMAGSQPITLAEFLRSLRASLGLRPTRSLAVPRPLMLLAATVGEHVPGASLTRETFGMLERGNVGDAAPLTRLLGRPPLAPRAFVDVTSRDTALTVARLDWLTPLLRTSVAFMWLIGGLVSLAPISYGDGLELLRRVGIPATAAPAMLIAAASLDLLLGVLTVLVRRAWLWDAQIAVVLLFTAIISLFLPEFWLHPFGPVAKNVPILAMLLLLRQLETRR